MANSSKFSNTSGVGASRDGDQFHYHWAARRCLELLPDVSDLVAVTVEGVSPDEGGGQHRVEEGLELIDVTEYFGSEELRDARLVRYTQLKHSTDQPDKAWPPSGMKDAISGFAERFLALEKAAGLDLANKLEFVFLSNRPISPRFLKTLDEVATGKPVGNARNVKKLEAYAQLRGPDLARFCRTLKLRGGQSDYLAERLALSRQTRTLMVAGSRDASLRLVSLVTSGATSEGRRRNTFRRTDVLAALDTDEDGLFPAPSDIATVQQIVPRPEAQEFAERILRTSRHTVITAAGGVGKTVFTSQLVSALRDDAITVVYDCFANGSYRQPSAPRHGHDKGPVQIANELAGMGGCLPLIPSDHGGDEAYLVAFRNRLRQAAAWAAETRPEGKVVILVDAADNAQMAAQEAGDRNSFIRDLLLDGPQENVRIVALCRPERLDMFELHRDTQVLTLPAFNIEQTALHLRQKFPEALDGAITEFHHLTSGNPRVQDMALQGSDNLKGVLDGLGDSPKSVDDAIKELLERTVLEIAEREGPVSNGEVEQLGRALAVLRPYIPVAVLSAASGLSVDVVRSIVSNPGLRLRMTDDVVQFRDEPVESWFRERFKPSPNEHSEFVDRLTPLTMEHSYIATALPELMLNAGRRKDLINIALSGAGLPEDNPALRRDIEQLRLRYALAASLEENSLVSAAKLAMRAGIEAEAASRQTEQIALNPDLAARFLGPGRVQEVVAHREIKDTHGDWPGRHYIHEASLLSHFKHLEGEARRRLRLAREWMHRLFRMPEDERPRDAPSIADIAEFGWAVLNIAGPERCVGFLNGWTPRFIAFEAGQIIARRLVDAGKFERLAQFVEAGTYRTMVILAVAGVLREAQLPIPERLLTVAYSRLKRRWFRAPFSENEVPDHGLHAMMAVLEAVSRHFIASEPELADVLKRYMPETPPDELRWSHQNPTKDGLLPAYALLAALAGRELVLEDVMPDRVRKEVDEEQKHQQLSHETDHYCVDVRTRSPWLTLRSRAGLGQATQADLHKLVEAQCDAAELFGWRSSTGRAHTAAAIARCWVESVMLIEDTDQADLIRVLDWIDRADGRISGIALTRIARSVARSERFQDQAVEFTVRARNLASQSTDGVEAKLDILIGSTRALLASEPYEAAEIFASAIDVAGEFGNELPGRWAAITDLAVAAGDRHLPAPELAYRFARCAEKAHQYIYSKYFPMQETLSGLVRLCPSSALATAARWRDREFEIASEILTEIVEKMVHLGLLAPATAVALYPLRGDWDFPNLLRAALADISDQSERQPIFDWFVGYAVHEIRSPEKWRAIERIAQGFSMSFPQAAERIEHAEIRSAEDGSYSSRLPKEDSEQPETDWDVIFAGLDLCEADDLEQAIKRHKSAGHYGVEGGFAREVFRRVQIGQAPACISAIGRLDDASLSDVTALLQSVPDQWRKRTSLRNQLRASLDDIVSRHGWAIGRSVYRAIGTPETVAEITGVTKQEVIRAMIASYAGGAQNLVGADFFKLVWLIAHLLDREAARDALSFCLSAFDDVLEPEDGDGPWTKDLEPPTSLTDALAGHIWSCLGSPDAATRWEAAHVVRSLAAVGDQNILEAVARRMDDRNAGRFGDARFDFYIWSARLWFLIALARTARERPELVRPLIPMLRVWALEREPHIQIRHFAADALQVMASHNSSWIDLDTQRQLSTVNKAPFPPAISRRWDRVKGGGFEGMAHDPEERMYFGIDLPAYWFKYAGEPFGLNSGTVERELEQLIIDEWGFKPDDRFLHDGRRGQRKFQQYRGSHSHGSSPQCEDLLFYLSYHALMIRAGEWLQRLTLHQDPADDRNEFAEWASGHLLTRSDGLWPYDGRDPTPLPGAAWAADQGDENWPWSVLETDFDGVLGLPDGPIIVLGAWHDANGGRREDVSIASALVAPERSLALLRALQTAASSHLFFLPSFGRGGDIDHSGLELTGWIVWPETGNRLDEFDPWAAGISCPSPYLAPFAEEQLSNLRAQKPELKAEAISRNWREPPVHHDDRAPQDGHLLAIESDCLFALLGRLEKDLIVEVRVEREGKRYGSDKHDWRHPREPNFRIYLFRADGSIRTLRGHPVIRRNAGQGAGA